MIKILHIAAECYPAAKAGGLADVVGALPKYLEKIGVSTGVIIPKYGTKWFHEQEFKQVYVGAVRLHNEYIPFAIEREVHNRLSFPLFVVNIPGKFDRNGIYADNHTGHGYGDDISRYLCFQQAVLQFVQAWEEKPAVLHCHDHHTGLIPFMVKHCPEYQSLAKVATVFTIHNGRYHGAFSWDNSHLLPWYEARAEGFLDWNHLINPLAAGIKCAWRVTTVSPTYMEELRNDSNGLEWLLQAERQKSMGILNGIDSQVWNPMTDPLIHTRFDGEDISSFKNANKRVICERFNINYKLPLVTFIGRLAGEKGSDILPELFRQFLYSGNKAAFFVLGAGDPRVRDQLLQMRNYMGGFFDASMEYNETLAHQLYAASDFLLMPSRVEPCGLNQMYAMRYGTVPIVRSTGGLIDTVSDIGMVGGRGIRFDRFALDDAHTAIYRATEVYRDTESMSRLRHRIMNIDFSWEKSAAEYKKVYESIF